MMCVSALPTTMGCVCAVCAVLAQVENHVEAHSGLRLFIQTAHTILGSTRYKIHKPPLHVSVQPLLHNGVFKSAPDFSEVQLKQASAKELV